MEDFTIYCTEEQTKKALELGAPLKVIDCSLRQFSQAVINHWRHTGRYTFIDNFQQPGEYWCKMIFNPTAGWMMGWLRTKGFAFGISEYNDHFNDHVFWRVALGRHWYKSSEQCKEVKEAIHAAIDAALEYLSTNKESV